MAIAAARTARSSGGGGRRAPKQQQKRRQQARPSATAPPPAPIIPYQARHLARASGQDATLRSALAFVVLRRRLAARAAGAAAVGGAGGSRYSNMAAGPGGGRKKRSRCRDDDDDDEDDQRRSNPSRPPPPPRPAPLADKSHVSHLVRLAIGTALPLGDAVLGIGIGAAGEPIGRRGPIVYDHRLASSSMSRKGAVGGASTNATAQRMAVLDGLLTHLSAHLSVVARSSPGDAKAIVREEFLDVLLARADAFEYRSCPSPGPGPNDCGRLIVPGEEEEVLEVEADGTAAPAAAAATPADAASTRLLLDRTKLVLAVCTVLHRLVVCGADGVALPAAIVGAASSYLRGVYDGPYPDGFDVSWEEDGYGGGNPGGRVGVVGRRSSGTKRVSFKDDYYDDDYDDDDDDDDDEDELTTIITAQVISLPRIGDTVAVNLLVLLEEVGLAAHLRSSCSYSCSCSCGVPSLSSGVILGALRGGFGEDLLLSPPLTVTSDAATFVRVEEMRIIAEIRRRKRRMKKKRGAALAMGAAGAAVKYVPLLDPGAKLMTRLALWDLVEKLSI
jgi:hypothetical protein